MVNRTEKRKLGDIGENIACDFLKSRGFEIIERNYLRKWGEIDIVTRKSERTKEEVDSERKNHLLRMDETKVKIKAELENTDKLRKDWENKHRDLRIITARLRKLWPPKMPFPKIDWI